MSTSMLAIEITEPGDPDVLKPAEREIPTPGPGEVLIEVKAAGVNRPDVVQRKGFYPPPPGASDIPGLEVAGTITAFGAGVTESEVGCALGDSVCALVTGGGYASHAVAPIETIVRTPKNFSFLEAAAIPENYYTVWSNLFDRAGLKAGETLLVHGGSSGIGSTAIQLAKAFDVKVITTAGSAEKVAFCRGLGADVAVNYKEADFAEAVMEATDGKGADVVLDMVGGDYIDKNISCMALEGRHVSIAFLNGPQVSFNMMPVMLKRLVLTGSTLRARDNAFKGAIANALEKHVWPLFEAGKIKPHIDSVYKAEDAVKAHAQMEASTHMGKIMLEFGTS